MKRLTSILAPPVLCIALLAGMTVEQSGLATAGTADPYHAQAKTRVEQIPRFIHGWSGTDVPLPPEAVKLLKPNAILSRRYEDAGSAGLNRGERWASLLVVQCRESRDMVGHYPKNCYPSSGWIELSSAPFDGSVGGVNIPATEYHFARTVQGRTIRQCVYNFLIVPNAAIVPDIKGVEQAAEDYQQRYFGAAQFQVIVSSELPREEREAIYRMLVGASLDAIKTLTSGDVQ